MSIEDRNHGRIDPSPATSDGVGPIGLTADEVLTTTRAVRKRLDFDRPVSRAVIEECLRMAFQAPSGANVQSWSWIFIEDPALKREAAAIYLKAQQTHMRLAAAGELKEIAAPPAKMIEGVVYLANNIHRAPYLLVPTIGQVYGDKTVFQQTARWASVMPAVWNFMLALRSRGLGSCWTNVHLHHEQEMAELLGIPYEENSQVGMFPIAYTLGTDFKLADRSASLARVGWNSWPGSV